MDTDCLFFFNDTATTEIYTLSLHDALPILRRPSCTSTPRTVARSFERNGEMCPGRVSRSASTSGTKTSVISNPSTVSRWRALETRRPTSAALSGRPRLPHRDPDPRGRGACFHGVLRRPASELQRVRQLRADVRRPVLLERGAQLADLRPVLRAAARRGCGGSCSAAAPAFACSRT